VKRESSLVSREVCADYARSSRLEWLETNGTGGYAMGTVAGANSRRYHGHLVASFRPPAERYVLISKLEEVVVIGGTEVALSTNQYPGAVYPEGYRRLIDFRLAPFPTWTFEVDGVVIEKTLFLVYGEQTVVVQYRANQPCRLRARPLLAFRDYHALAHRNDALNGQVGQEQEVLRAHPYAALPGLYLHHNADRFEENGSWYYNFEFLEELERGLDFREDLYCFGTLDYRLERNRSAFLVATLEQKRQLVGESVDDLERAERRRRARIPGKADSAARAGSSDESSESTARELARRLWLAADQFIVRRADETPSLVAGYPWFTDWGRDTMIALPGLFLLRGMFTEARDLLRGFLRYIDQGLIPNRFPDYGEQPEYNTADATLWMFQAVHAHFQATADFSFIRDEFYPVGKEILAWHQRGTHHGIRVDPEDGLLIAGTEGTQLTWMDARVEGRVVTPRHGKPVEVNALYYNALRLMETWAAGCGESGSAAQYSQQASRVRKAFAEKFWNVGRHFLNDVITPNGADARLRPNQLFAVSLPFPLIANGEARAVVDAVERELLTPVGLRTLARGEPGYVPHYQGGVAQRDGAYHQGTVWPWLLGPFVRAYLRTHRQEAEAKKYCLDRIIALGSELDTACLGTLAEIFEPEPPHRPVGAPAQAWSVGELLVALSLVAPTTAFAPSLAHPGADSKHPQLAEAQR
jgi:predicted glycogen debranching enzyme